MILDKTIIKKRSIKASIDNIWNKWTTHEGLLTFFGADNKVELRIGGAFEIYFMMDQPYGTRGAEGCEVLSFLPKKMLSFSWNAPTQFDAIRNGNHQTWVVVEMIAVGNVTEVTLTHLGWLEGEDWNAVYDYFVNAWDMVMDNLVKSCS